MVNAMTEVRLVDLEVITRYSLAVRRDTVDAKELLAALEDSRKVVLEALGRRSRAGSAPKPKPRPRSKAVPASRRRAGQTSKTTARIGRSTARR